MGEPRVDFLVSLPPEIVLRIVKLSDLTSIARLEQVNKAWNSFVKEHHGPIWASAASVLGGRTGDVIQERNSVPPTYEEGDLQRVLAAKWSPEPATWQGVETWKEYCKRKMRLLRNMDSQLPKLSDRILNTGVVTTWRLRPDYEARTVVCTAHQGGLWVYDMDTGKLLWNLSESQVGPHAHLEHSKGTLAFNPGMDDTIEIWRRADLAAAEGNQSSSSTSTPSETPQRGAYVRVGCLPHSNFLRGWHLLYPTLCVVSNQGKAWIYDVSTSPPELQRTITIPEGARGHLEQNEEVVMYCMKHGGYDFYEKKTGRYMGKLHGELWAEEATPNYYHIPLPEPADSAVISSRGQDGRDATVRHCNVTLRPGLVGGTSMRAPNSPQEVRDEDQGDWGRPNTAEWGAGMLYGDIMIGVARQGWVMICSDWPKVLKNPQAAQDCVAFIATNPPDEHDRTVSVRSHDMFCFLHCPVLVTVLRNGAGDCEVLHRRPYRVQ